jgi:hypothetical protein
VTLVRAHVLALATTRTFGRLAAIALGAALFLAVSFLGVRNLAGTTAGDLQRALSQAGVAGIVAFLAGAAAAGSDRRHGVLPWLVVGSSARARLVGAQAIAVGAAWALAGLACALGVLAVVALILALDGASLPAAGASLRAAGGVLLYAGLAGAAGVGWGHLVGS